MTRGEHKLQNKCATYAGSSKMLPVFLFCILNNFQYIYTHDKVDTNG